jgi:hypothetical protein
MYLFEFTLRFSFSLAMVITYTCPQNWPCTSTAQPSGLVSLHAVLCRFRIPAVHCSSQHSNPRSCFQPEISQCSTKKPGTRSPLEAQYRSKRTLRILASPSASVQTPLQLLRQLKPSKTLSRQVPKKPTHSQTPLNAQYRDIATAQQGPTAVNTSNGPSRSERGISHASGKWSRQMTSTSGHGEKKPSQPHRSVWPVEKTPITSQGPLFCPDPKAWQAPRIPVSSCSPPHTI